MAYQPLTVQELESILDRDNAVLLDIRDKHSYQQAHIPGAQLADDRTIRRLIGERQPGRHIVVYCYHGNSSRDFCGLLTGFGFTRLYNLEGGWQAWQNARSSLTAVATGALAEWLEREGFDTSNLNSRAANGMSPLMLAAQQGRLPFVEQLIEAGADVNLLNDDGNAALWFACVSNNSDLVARLVRAGADLDNQNVNGATCLIYAASTGKLAVVGTLIDAGADPSRQTLDGFTALDCASTLPVLRFLKPCVAALQLSRVQGVHAYEH